MRQYTRDPSKTCVNIHGIQVRHALSIHSHSHLCTMYVKQRHEWLQHSYILSYYRRYISHKVYNILFHKSNTSMHYFISVSMVLHGVSMATHGTYTTVFSAHRLYWKTVSVNGWTPLHEVQVFEGTKGMNACMTWRRIDKSITTMAHSCVPGVTV